MEKILITVTAISSISGVLALLLSIANKTIANYGEMKMVINDEKEYTVDGGDTLLTTLVENEIFIPSACGGKGSCGYCKVTVVEGGGQFLPTEAGYVTEEEQKEGVRLSCQCKVKEDIKIAIPEELFNVRQYDYRVAQINTVTEKIKHLHLDLPQGKEIQFKPGQYIQILTPTYKGNSEEVYRAYSIASSPSKTTGIELFIGYIPEGICTTFIHQFLKEKDKLTVVGPFGDFMYQETDREMVMGAIGTGMAPILSIIRHMYEHKIERKCTFFFSARTRKDLFMMDELLKYESEMPNLTLRFSLTRPTPECNWDGDTGRIPQVMEKYLDGDGNNMESYLCGSPIMIDAVTKVLLKKGIPEEQIYYDKFS